LQFRGLVDAFFFNESFNPETFDPGHLDISSKYDKTLEEVMFEDDLPLDVGLSYIQGISSQTDISNLALLRI
jgi:hypothetical protein